MSIIEELQTKLSETRDNVEKVLVDLSHYSQVKDSLQAANIAAPNLRKLFVYVESA